MLDPLLHLGVCRYWRCVAKQNKMEDENKKKEQFLIGTIMFTGALPIAIYLIHPEALKYIGGFVFWWIMCLFFVLVYIYDWLK
jgi:hypothetical protein